VVVRRQAMPCNEELRATISKAARLTKQQRFTISRQRFTARRLFVLLQGTCRRESRGQTTNDTFWGPTRALCSRRSSLLLQE